MYGNILKGQRNNYKKPQCMVIAWKIIQKFNAYLLSKTHQCPKLKIIEEKKALIFRIYISLGTIYFQGTNLLVRIDKSRNYKIFSFKTLFLAWKYQKPVFTVIYWKKKIAFWYNAQLYIYKKIIVK